MAYNGRIWLGWRPHIQVHVLQVSEQFLHCKVETTAFTTMLTIVYAKNEAQLRKSLWSDLIQIGRNIQEPWHLSGDFNAVLTAEHRVGSQVTQIET
ncbi:hypothetical protein RDI58_008442 [Solanum bulbocastanum]|uniref:Reverse transcriptase n=1 Tax=Solanum bulbocastanum TaxID=147425 RepID=A0AAN8TYC3_SOLBU